MSNIGNGNKGRFSDRLKRMRYNRLYRKKKIVLEDGKIIYKNFLKVVAIIPLMVAGNILDIPTKDDKKKITINKKDATIKKEYRIKLGNVNKQQVCVAVPYKNKKIGKRLFNDNKVPIIQNLKKKPQIVLEKKEEKQSAKGFFEPQEEVINKLEKEKEQADNVETINGIREETKAELDKKADVISEIMTRDSVKKLEKKIINLIKKDLVKIVNLLEIYESELYILSEINGDEKTLEQCKKNIAEVKKLLAKIEELKKKYDYLRDTYDFEYLLEVDNDEIIDKITELKTIVNNDEIKTVVADYKLLDVYKYLYTKVDEIKENTGKIEEEKLKQEEKLKERDIDFEKLKGKVFDINRANESYAYFVNQQNNFLNSLSDKISKIDSHEVVNYNIKGFGKYLANSFKYFGLLMLNPLKGIFPSIVTQTVFARGMVKNLRDNLTWEEKRKTVYEVQDYSSIISYAISDLDYTSGELDCALDDLAKLKMEYNDKFRQYQGDFLEYHDVINKITSMQEAMINNKIKLEIIKGKMKNYQKENENALQLVKQLNNEEEVDNQKR